MKTLLNAVSAIANAQKKKLAKLKPQLDQETSDLIKKINDYKIIKAINPEEAKEMQKQIEFQIDFYNNPFLEEQFNLILSEYEKVERESADYYRKSFQEIYCN